MGSIALGSILSRYILREVVTSWLVVTGVLLVILLANEVVGVLERAAANQYPQSVVLELIGLGALQYLAILLPVGLLLGVVLAFGRLYHDSELTAAVACGAGPGYIYLPVALLAVVVAAGLAWLSLVLAPQATARGLALRNAALHAGQLAPLVPGKFRTFSGGANAVVYAESVARDGTLGNVFLERNRGPLVEMALAQRATQLVFAPFVGEGVGSGCAAGACVAPACGAGAGPLPFGVGSAETGPHHATAARATRKSCGDLHGSASRHVSSDVAGRDQSQVIRLLLSPIHARHHRRLGDPHRNGPNWRRRWRVCPDRDRSPVW